MSDWGLGATPRWASDPTGRHRFRYWDGHAWTPHVYDGAQPPRRAPRPLPGDEETWAAPADEEPDPGERPRRGRRRRDDDDDGGGGAVVVGGMDRRSFLTGALAGGALVAVIAIIAALVLGGDKAKTSNAAHRTKETTTTTVAPSTTTLLTTTTVAGRPPSQVKVTVLNGSGVGGAATKKGDALKAAGYNVIGLGNTSTQQGTVVECNTGFEAEANALATAVGEGATVQPLSTPPPSGMNGADCVVILGTPTSTTTPST